MRQKIKKIKNAQHPHSGEMLTQITEVDKFFRYIQIGLGIFGSLLALAMAIRLSINTENYSEYEYEINIFGYFLEVSHKSFLGSPIIMFLYVDIIFDFIVLLLGGVRLFIRTLLTAKVKMLDTAYQTELLTALLVDQSCDLENFADEREMDGKNTVTEESAKNLAGVPVEIKDGKICCPVCGKNQPADRKACWYCWTVFNTDATEN